MDLSSLFLKSSTMPELVPCPGGASCRRANCDGPTGSFWITFKSPTLMRKSLICEKLAGVIGAFTHAPEVVFFDQVQFIRTLPDADGGDVIDGKIVAEQFLAGAFLAGIGRAVATLLEEPAAPPRTIRRTRRIPNCFRFIWQTCVCV